MKESGKFVVNGIYKHQNAVKIKNEEEFNQTQKRPILNTNLETPMGGENDFNNFKLFIKRLFTSKAITGSLDQALMDMKALFPTTQNRKTIFFKINLYTNDLDMEKAYISHKDPNTLQSDLEARVKPFPEFITKDREVVSQQNLRPRTLTIPKKIIKKKNKLNPRNFQFHRFFNKRTFVAREGRSGSETLIRKNGLITGPKVVENINVNRTELIKNTITCYLERLKSYWNGFNPSCPHIFAGQGQTYDRVRYERLDYCLKMIPTMNDNEG